MDLEVGLEAYFHTRIFDRQLVAAAEVALVEVTHQGVAAKEWALGWATVPLFDKVRHGKSRLVHCVNSTSLPASNKMMIITTHG